jgi:hypothetical protein
MSTTSHKQQYTTIGVFEDTKKALDKAILVASAKKGEKITYNDFIKVQLIKVKKQKC